jgi:hypothetical protein
LAVHMKEKGNIAFQHPVLTFLIHSMKCRQSFVRLEYIFKEKNILKPHKRLSTFHRVNKEKDVDFMTEMNFAASRRTEGNHAIQRNCCYLVA